MLWEEIINISKNKNYNIKQIFQEEMQKTILTYLSREGVFNDIVFQGGTSLRLFYNNPRFSEDLDFVFKDKNKKINLLKKTRKLNKFVLNSYPFIEKIKINNQKNDEKIQRIIFKTYSKNTYHKLRIQIELANVPSYKNEPKILNFPPLNPAIRVERLEEILADKIIALCLRSYIKGRDIWDIYFLTNEKNIHIPWNLVYKKSNDYDSNPDEIKNKIKTVQNNLKKEGVKSLENEMKRFLPPQLVEQYDQKFKIINNHVSKIIIETIGEK